MDFRARIRAWLRGTSAFLIVFAMLTVGSTDAVGQEQADGGAVQPGWGLRTGFGLGPDQLVVGGQVGVTRVLQIASLVLSGDLGFLSNVTTFALNGDFLVNFLIPESTLAFYGGGGPTLALIDPSGSGSSWEFGLSLVAGMRLPTNTRQDFNLEARFGIGDIPDFRLLLGIFF